MSVDFPNDPFRYPVYLDKWVLLPSDDIEFLRVEKVTCSDGRVRYYYPTKPSFAHPKPVEFAPEEVSDSRNDVEAERSRREWDELSQVYGFPSM